MADVRALLKAKREEARITHPYAAYNPSGQLKCTVCGSVVKHASAWEGHLGSKAHRTNIIRLREQEKQRQQQQEQAQQESEDSPEPTRKRKATGDQTPTDDVNAGKKRRVQTPSQPPQSSSSFPQDFFSDPSRAPVPLSDSDEEEEEEEGKPIAEKQEPTSASTGTGVDEEYERFQRELLSSNPDPTDTYDRATVAAEPVLASIQIDGFPPTIIDEAPPEPAQLTEEEARQKREQEERELIMDKLLAEERAQEDADTRVQLLKIKLEALRKKREAAKANKLKDTR